MRKIPPPQALPKRATKVGRGWPMVRVTNKRGRRKSLYHFERVPSNEEIMQQEMAAHGYIVLRCSFQMFDHRVGQMAALRGRGSTIRIASMEQLDAIVSDIREYLKLRDATEEIKRRDHGEPIVAAHAD